MAVTQRRGEELSVKEHTPKGMFFNEKSESFGMSIQEVVIFAIDVEARRIMRTMPIQIHQRSFSSVSSFVS
jgi:hypothetical protein